MKKLVSIRAITERLNRKLAKESKKLLKYTPRLDRGDGLIEYEVIDLKTQAIINYHTASELESFARGLGCLTLQEEVSFE